MNANFDEKQAFENLHDIFNHIYNFANYYYAEMQTAQKLCATKDNTITDLKNQLADERKQAATHLEKTIQSKDAEIAAQRDDFEEKLAAHNDELANSREHNEKLTRVLENLRNDLQERKESLDKRENSLNEREKQLQNDSDTLVAQFADLYRERDTFYSMKELREQTPSDAERIQQLDNDLRDLTLKNRNLKTELADANETLKKVQDENEKLKTIVKNADAERQGMDFANRQTEEIEPAGNFGDDVNVAPMKGFGISEKNFNESSATNDVNNTDENLNDRPAENSAENTDDVNDSKKTDVPYWAKQS